MKPIFAFPFLVLFLLVACAGPMTLAQVGNEGRSDRHTEIDEWQPRLFPADSPRVWEIGLEITALEPTDRIRAIFPVPVDWPEQQVELLDSLQSPHVAGSRLDKVKNNVRWMHMEIPHLPAGETASFLVRLQIRKSSIEPPIDPSSLVFQKKPSRETGAWLSPSPLIESRHRRILELAESIPVDESQPAWNQVETIYQWVKENIEYKFAAKNRSVIECLDSSIGDCGEMSGLFIALCRARGIPARAVWIPEHTYPEFYLEDIHGNGWWFPCQVAGEGAFGGMVEPKPILQKGDRFRIPGMRGEQRYLQPTLSAEGGSASMKFVTRAVEPDVKSGE